MIKTIYSDFDIELPKQNDGDIQRDIDIEAVKNSIQNIFTTRQGTRRMLPEFAAPYNHILFEPMDDYTAHRLGNMLVDGIQKWDDRVIIENLNVNSNYDQMRYECILTFRIESLEESQTVKFILAQG